MIFGTPVIYTNSEALNLDDYIQRLQTSLTGLPWLQYVFGRAWKAYTKTDGSSYTYPEVYTNQRDMQNMFALNEFQSYIFFYARDKGEPALNYEPGTFNEWEQSVDIICWFNMGKTNPDRPFLQTEQYLADVRKVLRLQSFYTPTGVFYDAENVFKDFTLDSYASQYLRHPFGGFRIEGKIQFLERDNFDDC